MRCALFNEIFIQNYSFKYMLDKRECQSCLLTIQSSDNLRFTASKKMES